MVGKINAMKEKLAAAEKSNREMRTDLSWLLVGGEFAYWYRNSAGPICFGAAQEYRKALERHFPNYVEKDGIDIDEPSSVLMNFVNKLYAAPPVPDGMVMVPVEPTMEMIIAGNESLGSADPRRHTVKSCYKAMIAAAKP